MKDYLQDIIAHTNPVKDIDLVKIEGTDTETTVSAVPANKSIIMFGKFKTPHPSFKGVFGMPNLNKLKTVLDFDEYDENAKLTMNTVDKNGVQVPNNIHFETQNGDFVNDYRLMNKELVEEQVANAQLAVTPVFQVSFEPAAASIMRLKKQYTANSEETVFTTATVNNELRIYFGDPSTHSGNFVFATGITGVLKNRFMWPSEAVVNILTLNGDKTFKISDQGLIEIIVDSGLSTYSYMIPSQRK